jgi:hypothetical protein
MTRLRLRVAERLKGAQNTYAMLTTFNEVRGGGGGRGSVNNARRQGEQALGGRGQCSQKRQVGPVHVSTSSRTMFDWSNHPC